MWLRTSILAAIAVSLATGGYSLGASKKPLVEAAKRTSTLGPEHPVTIALQQADLKPAQREQLLKLSDQAALDKLQVLKMAQAKAQQLQALSRQKEADIALLERKLDVLSEELSTQKNQGSKVALRKVQAKLREARTIKDVAAATSDQMDTLMFRAIDDEAAVKGVAALSGEQKDLVFEVVATRRTLDANKGFALMKALEHRDMIGLSPQQVTALQLLQADFIRFFAPLRERFELLSSGEQTYEVTLVPTTGQVTVSDVPIKVTGEVKLDLKPKNESVEIRTVQGQAYKVNLNFTGKHVNRAEKFAVQRVDAKETAALEAELKALKDKYNAKTYSELKPEQQAKLRNLMK